MAFAELEPFGGTIEDLRAGLGPAMTANVNRGPNGQTFAPLDFFPWHRAATAQPEPEDEAELTEQQRIARRILRLGQRA
jgi:hypothetical protein